MNVRQIAQVQFGRFIQITVTVSGFCLQQPFCNIRLIYWEFNPGSFVYYNHSLMRSGYRMNDTQFFMFHSLPAICK